MKTIIEHFQQHRMVSVFMLIIFISLIVVSLTVPKGEPKPKDSPVATEQTSKMDKFKSGTIKPAKKIGY